MKPILKVYEARCAHTKVDKDGKGYSCAGVKNDTMSDEPCTLNNWLVCPLNDRRNRE